MPARILLVDDEKIVLELLENTVANIGGFVTLLATDGVEALRMATEELPDLVVLDINLPALGGFEVLEELKKRKLETRVIMISGYDTDIPTAIRCIRSGACDYLTKPFDPQNLVERIKRCLEIDSATNLLISQAPPIIDSLVAETGELNSENQFLRILANQILHNIAFVGTALTTVFLLSHYEIISSQKVLALLLFGLSSLMMIPSRKIRKIAADFKNFTANVEMDS